MRSPHEHDWRLHPLTPIRRPKYDRAGNLIDPGDSDIPGMVELWETIDAMSHRYNVLRGAVKPDTPLLIEPSDYHLYLLKHALVDLRRHQYYLKDCYKPALHFMNAAHPRPQFIDWTANSQYWTTQPQVKDAPTITRDGQTYYLRVVREHIFDWEDPAHIAALINVYDLIYNQFYTKLDTYARTLIFDLNFYLSLGNFTPLRLWLISQKLAHIPYEEILARLREQWGVSFNINHLSFLYSVEVPRDIAKVARLHHLIVDTPPSRCKKCTICGRLLPQLPEFFARNRSHKDGLSSSCKECAKKTRLKKRGGGTIDYRSKEAQVYALQTRQARN